MLGTVVTALFLTGHGSIKIRHATSYLLLPLVPGNIDLSFDSLSPFPLALSSHSQHLAMYQQYPGTPTIVTYW